MASVRTMRQRSRVAWVGSPWSYHNTSMACSGQPVNGPRMRAGQLIRDPRAGSETGREA
ncbi:hypothetical protein [Streptomyces scopuliridis]|uniref:hypothetical protein n=1 Tax=Streptomyces scopuliridis TaxID=452529 RepID=UPI003673AE64